MIREGLRRLVRAACAALGDDTVVIIGSQSILGSFGDFMLPAAATISVEADLLLFDDLDESKADQIDGLLGADSYFAAKYGIYADRCLRVDSTPARGWHQRLVRFEDPESGSVGLCLHPEDLCVAKLLAGREKDIDFVGAVLGAGLVDPAVVTERLGTVPLRPSEVPLKGRAELRLRTMRHPQRDATGPPVARADIMRLGDKLERMAEAARLCGRVLPDLTPCLQDRRTCALHP